MIARGGYKDGGGRGGGRSRHLLFQCERFETLGVNEGDSTDIKKVHIHVTTIPFNHKMLNNNKYFQATPQTKTPLAETCVLHTHAHARAHTHEQQCMEQEKSFKCFFGEHVF